MIGRTISHYKITAKLGEGGMGVVYRAEDTKLDRTVALKFVAANLIRDGEARKRFEREAKAAAGVSHANVCHVYEIAEAEGQTFLAMEFVEGESLDQRIDKGPLALRDALDIAHQIADGLAAAHEQGVVHRDIKPGNLLITSKGQVKILDFGLALLTEGSKLTQLDTKVGTVAYMSPEQAQGMEVDHRSDIWSLGCVLYEMVCGQRPFRGAYDQALLYEIINQESEPLTGLRTGVPMELDFIAGKCLAKDLEDRYRHADEVASDLRSLSKKLASGKSTILPVSKILASGAAHRDAAPVTLSGQAASVWNKKALLAGGALAAVVFLIALILAIVHLREAPAQQRTVRFSVRATDVKLIEQFAIAPDGRHVVFSGAGETQSQLWVRSLDSLEVRALPGTEHATFPFWSPDSANIGFFAEERLKRIALAGGPPQTLCEAPFGRGGTWNHEGVIVFATSAYYGATSYFGLHRVEAGGGPPAPLMTPDGTKDGASRSFPRFLPDGRRFLYLVRSRTVAENGAYLGSLDSNESRRLVTSDSQVEYAPELAGGNGHLLFVREGALMAQPLAVGRAETMGDAFPVAGRVRNNIGTFGGWGAFSVSEDGVLVYQAGGVDRLQLVWLDRQGKPLGSVGEPADYSSPALSRDEKKLAVGIRDPSTRTRDLWLFDLARATGSRLTFDPADDLNPIWSPDGTRIVFTSSRQGGRNIFQKSASGEGESELVFASTEPKSVEDWSSDGQYLVYNITTVPYSVWALPMAGKHSPIPLLTGEFMQHQTHLSPNGRWIGYTSEESGRSEIYVRSFSPTQGKGNAGGGGKWQVSTDGGEEAAWRRDGKELFFLDHEGRNLMAVTVETDSAGFDAGAPKVLFPAPALGNKTKNRYLVSADGQRFLFNTLADDNENSELTVMVNWLAQVQR